jgi:LPS O-antigen subunit length determinant protein (WzzB/FepE family)
LNEQLREQAIQDSRKRVGYLEKELAKTTLKDMRDVLYSLLESEKQKAMLANVNEDFALEVIDPAVAPEQREKPKRKLIVGLGGVCGGFLGIFLVFFLQFIKKLKTSDSEPHLSHA